MVRKFHKRFWKGLGCILVYTQKWQQIRLSTKGAYFTEYSTHDCAGIYRLKIIIIR